MRRVVNISLQIYMIICLLSLVFACNSPQQTQAEKTIMKKSPDPISEDGRSIISAPIVKKSSFFPSETNESKPEYYLRRSIQDYYIKFCESKVSIGDVENHLANLDTAVPSLKVEVEFREGDWDDCEGGTTNKEGRQGPYVVIYRLLAED